MRNPHDAHFLHQKTGLEMVVRAPVPSPTALAWVPAREEVVVATRSGSLYHVDPLLGTRQIAGGVGEGASVVVSPDRARVGLVTRDGHWMVLSLKGEIESRGKHGFLAGIDAVFVSDHLVVLGDGVEGRSLIVIKDGQIKARANVPPRVVPRVHDGKLSLVLSIDSGLAQVPFTRTLKFPVGEATAHRLRVVGDLVLGVTSSAFVVWRIGDPTVRSMRLPDLSVGDLTKDGAHVAVGTRFGQVTLSPLGRRPRRDDEATGGSTATSGTTPFSAAAKPRPVKASDGPVTCIGFSDRGRWLATGGDALILWTWETDD